MNAIAQSRTEVRAVVTREESRLAHDLMARAHVPEYSSSMTWLESSALAYPGLRREHTRIALRDGILAGALRLTTDTVRLGEARLKMGGLGWVTTAPDHRHRGVCTALIEDTLAYMRAHGYHVSMLFGIPNFYHRFGYATTLADYSITTEITELPTTITEGPRVRPAKPGDISAIQRIHRDNDANVSCSLIRSSGHYAAKWSQFSGAQIVANEHGRVMGYFLAKAADGLFDITSVGIATVRSAPDVLAAIAHAAQEAYCPKVRFNIPPEHPLAHVLSRYESLHEMRLSRERGGMMTFVDVGESLETMVPEWEARLSEGGLCELRAETTLVVDRRPFLVQAHRGALSIRPVLGRNKVSLAAADLIHLVTGYVHLEDVLVRAPRLLSSDARALLAALFPKRNPYVHLFDRF